MNQFITPEKANARLDALAADKIEKYVRKFLLPHYTYTISDLNKKINDEETLMEYIRDTENTFELEKVDVENLCDSELNMYIAKLDLMWSLFE